MPVWGGTYAKRFETFDLEVLASIRSKEVVAPTHYLPAIVKKY